MVTGRLPEDGEVQLAPLLQVPGKQIVPVEGPGDPVAWVTTDQVSYPGPVWSALSDMHQQTGLVPIMLASEPNTISSGVCFYLPSDVSELDHTRAATVLAGLWADRTPPDFDQDPYYAAERAPFGRPFPGLAPPEDARLTTAQLSEVLTALPAAHIGLIPAQRPADVLPLTGWLGPDLSYPDNLSLAAIMRSWEDRFGARLLHIGPGAELQLLVQRPPRTLESAQRIAAEHYVFADAFCRDYGKPTRTDLTTIPETAPILVNAPTWSFWWD